MKVIANWRDVLTKAWSVRLVIVAAVLSGLEVILPFFEVLVPKGLFALLSFLVTAAALVARIVAQSDLPHDA